MYLWIIYEFYEYVYVKEYKCAYNENYKHHEYKFFKYFGFLILSSLLYSEGSKNYFITITEKKVVLPPLSAVFSLLKFALEKNWIKKNS